jgi:hypothetical protein
MGRRDALRLLATGTALQLAPHNLRACDYAVQQLKKGEL